MHPLLARQLRRRGIEPASAPEPWKSLLANVDATYEQADQDRNTIERSLSISSDEMRELYDGLQSASESQLAVERDRLRRSLAVFRATVEASPDGVLVVDEHRKVIAHNRRFAEMWRIPQEVIATGDDDAALASVLALLRDPEEFMRRVRELYDAPAASSDEEVVLLDGRHFARRSEPVRDVDGAILGRVWFFRDVTAERRQEAEMRDAHVFLDSIIENIPDMIFVKDAAHLRFVRLNVAGERLLGIDRNEMVGRSDRDFFPDEQAELFIARDREVLERGELVHVPAEPIDTRALGRRTLQTKKIPIRDGDGNARFLLGISRDITEEQAREVELRRAKERAERAARAKADFLANMSHELRTPLSAILGFGRVLSRGAFGELNERQREHLGYVMQASEHMLALINDLLDLRKLEENATALARERLSLRSVVVDAVSLVRPLLDEKRQTLDDAFDDLVVHVDRRALLQVLVNLLSNAVKYTPSEGHIAVRGARDAAAIVIEVVDDGPGLSREQRERLFTYFEQLGAKHALGMAGTGIGLALTRSLVHAMGGTIDVVSEVGRGSTFRVVLEAAPGSAR